MTELHTQLIPHLCGGVSKQPAFLRGLTQSEDELNTWPSLSEGLRKRPATTFMGKLELEEKILFAHGVDIGRTTFVLLITSGKIHVVDPYGREVIVKGSESLYLKGHRFACVCMDDETFILNKDIVPQMGRAGTSEVKKYKGILYVRQAIRDTLYTVAFTVGGQTFECTHSTKNLPRESGIDTDAIANGFCSNLRYKLPSSFVLTQKGSKILIENASRDFTIKAYDGFGDEGIVAIKDAVGDFVDLPRTGFPGFTVEVTSDLATSGHKKDSFYVSYRDNGVWKETVKPGFDHNFDSSTLPHKLVLNEDGTFSFGPIQWAKRDVGDDLTAPQPSFIGTQISDMFFFKSRLGFLCGSNVVFSEVDDFNNFWPTTTATVIDSDPLDLTICTGRSANLLYACPLSHSLQTTTTGLQASLLLFGEREQFVLSTRDILSPHTVSIEPQGQFSSICSKPVQAEQSVVFVTRQERAIEVKEIAPNSEGNPIETLTDHVPDWLPPNISYSVSLPNEKLILFYAKGSNTVYVYKYHWRKDIRVQSAWTQWTFAHAIQSIIPNAQGLILIVSTSNGETLLLKMVFRPLEAPLLLDSGVSFEPGRKDVGVKGTSAKGTGAYNPKTQTTFWDLPFLPESHLEAYTTDPLTGELAKLPVILDPVSPVISAMGDWSNAFVTFGYPYAFSYTFSPFLIKQETASGQVVTDSSKIPLIRDLVVSVQDTKTFDMMIGSSGESVTRYTHQTSSQLPQTVRLFILDKPEGLTVRLVNSTPHTCVFQNATWRFVHANIP